MFYFILILIIIALYDHIKKDDRHKNAAMISSSPIKERSFPSWQMGAKRFDNIGYQTDMTQSEKEAFKSIFQGIRSKAVKLLGSSRSFFK